MTEPYTITPEGREVLLVIRQDQEMRAWHLARALRGRWSPGLRGFYLTPARAEKWKILFAAGFTAEMRRSYGEHVWAFERGDRRGLSLSEAMNLAQLPPPAAPVENFDF